MSPLSSDAKPALRHRTVVRSALTPIEEEGMWTVFSQYYEKIDRARFRRDLEPKTHVILLLLGEEIVGFSTQELLETRVDGKRSVVLYSGDTILDRRFWGSSVLQTAFAFFIVELKARNPLVPVYWFLVSKGYKTYLLLSRNFPNYWPRPESQMPKYERTLLRHLAETKFGDAYDAERGVLRMAGQDGCLKPGVAPINESNLQEPDIRFFHDQNPMHASGDELCCLGRVDAAFFLFYGRKRLRKLIKMRSLGSPLRVRA